MMGSLGQAQNDTESIAQFMQRLSQATNIFISPEDPTGKLPTDVLQMFGTADDRRHSAENVRCVFPPT